MAAGRPLDRRVAWAFTLAPFVTLAAVLRQLPALADAATPAGWAPAAAVSAGLFVLAAASSFGHERWATHSPNRILVNEFVARTFFVVAGFAVVAGRDTAPLYLLMGAAWGVASWCTHYLFLRRQGTYRALENLAQLGLFLLGLALMALVSVRLALPV